MGGNGNGGDKTGDLGKITKELTGLELPNVLSSYMTGDNLPQEYAGIQDYVTEVRKRLIRDAGGRLNQLQSIVLDGICEILLVLKFISTMIGDNPSQTLICFNKSGVPGLTDLAIKGFSGLHQVLDKKIKQFHELTVLQSRKEEDEGYLKAVMGDVRPVKTGRPEGRKN